MSDIQINMCELKIDIISIMTPFISIDGYVVKSSNTKIRKEEYYVLGREIIKNRTRCQGTLIEWKRQYGGYGRSMDEADTEALWNVMDESKCFTIDGGL